MSLLHNLKLHAQAVCLSVTDVPLISILKECHIRTSTSGLSSITVIIPPPQRPQQTGSRGPLRESFTEKTHGQRSTHSQNTTTFTKHRVQRNSVPIVSQPIQPSPRRAPAPFNHPQITAYIRRRETPKDAAASFRSNFAQDTKRLFEKALFSSPAK